MCSSNLETFLMPEAYSDSARYKDWWPLSVEILHMFSGEPALLFPLRNLMLHDDGKCEQ
jgi:hypothetical protein